MRLIIVPKRFNDYVGTIRARYPGGQGPDIPITRLVAGDVTKLIKVADKSPHLTVIFYNWDELEAELRDLKVSWERSTLRASPHITEMPLDGSGSIPPITELLLVTAVDNDENSITLRGVVPLSKWSTIGEAVNAIYLRSRL